ncbi:MAG TPA: hypothetical protein VGP47_06415 [Parachlamydiaceae bacterium]|nr:hypothetical protein [Parachlamydiaceae bacterium]
MPTYTVALFGEAEKGDYQRPCLCRSVGQLLDLFGNPPLHSQGIYYAIQALLYQRALLFFRVREEGFSHEDYLHGLHLLQKQTLVSGIDAVCLPGVGNMEIIGAMAPIIELYHSLLIINESDFYDYLTIASCK